ncbi:hypothetical protein JG688_00002459 [Phytophthora aleatoria]|uniref:RxLR effector protein n=1 Tax=Phytophthora aleatoria TaxID=2496075 RepID=A0A8J5JCB7_9STRA|nr:hypothetical protein JG688_00002459 [Phytophthora aleatoria]
MSLSYFLLIALVVLLASAAEASTVGDSTTSNVFSVSTNRNLRAQEISRDTTNGLVEDLSKEARGFPTWTAEKADEVAEKVSWTVPNINLGTKSQLINEQVNRWIAVGKLNVANRIIAAKGWDPKSLARTLGIERMVKTMSKAELKNSEDYLFWVSFSKFWYKESAKYNKIAYGKSAGML